MSFSIKLNLSGCHIRNYINKFKTCQIYLKLLLKTAFEYIKYCKKLVLLFFLNKIDQNEIKFLTFR